mmetsp:Transcript_15858/g.32166  ORF Transcript_15858/g.32166 Transcript_15858/m.32166 type:complete len:205 (+) Transcript_15858:188-802(+)
MGAPATRDDDSHHQEPSLQGRHRDARRDRGGFGIRREVRLPVRCLSQVQVHAQGQVQCQPRVRLCQLQDVGGCPDIRRYFRGLRVLFQQLGEARLDGEGSHSGVQQVHCADPPLLHAHRIGGLRDVVPVNDSWRTEKKQLRGEIPSLGQRTYSKTLSPEVSPDAAGCTLGLSGGSFLPTVGVVAHGAVGAVAAAHVQEKKKKKY